MTHHTFYSSLGRTLCAFFVFALLQAPFASFGLKINFAAGTVSTCNDTLYDSGGPTADYANGNGATEILQTICSSSGNCIRLNFVSFNTQSGNDLLTIYDGNSNTDPIIGVFSGTNSPGLIVSSTGCITLGFVADAAVTRAGWMAIASCASCGSNIPMTTTALSTQYTCGGLLFDDGGANLDYANNIISNRTICAGTAGSCLQLTFTDALFNTGDSLSIWNGSSTASPLIGHFDGGASVPPVILSTSGCLTLRWKTDSRQVAAGFQAIISCEPCPSPPAATATYTSPITGLQRTYVGSNMVNTCGGTFTDDGGINGNYSNSLNQYYRTFCPNTPRNCLRATFWSVDIQPPQAAFYTDRLYVQNGPTQGSPTIDVLYGTATNYQACQQAGFGPYVSTDQSGCLTFRFASDATTTQAGWVCTFDCVPCANGPSGTDNNDCITPTALCQDIGFSDASTGPGIRSEGGTGCVLSENYSNWYKLVVSQSGTLGLIIRPVTASDDYDFALYKTTSCASLGSPVRCSYAANTGNTGMDNAQNLAVNTAGCGVANNGSDFSEDVCGNAWVDALNVVLGETYYLLVNNWSPGGNGFTLDWTLSNSASLNCIILPVELLHFSAVPNGNMVDLTWTTASETNNDYFTIERSVDGQRFEPISTVDGAGTITHERTYLTIDQHPYKGVSYYRLKQTDFDGKFTYSEVIAVKMDRGRNFFQLVPNPAENEFTLLFSEPTLIKRTVRVVDVSGRLLLEQIVGPDSHESLRFDVSDYAGGIYYVSVTDDQVTNTLPLVVR